MVLGKIIATFLLYTWIIRQKKKKKNRNLTFKKIFKLKNEDQFFKANWIAAYRTEVWYGCMINYLNYVKCKSIDTYTF